MPIWVDHLCFQANKLKELKEKKSNKNNKKERKKNLSCNRRQQLKMNPVPAIVNMQIRKTDTLTADLASSGGSIWKVICLVVGTWRTL